MLAAFASAFHALQPAACPGFAFSWLELVSHRSFMPKLLLVKQNKGWSYMHRLLIDLLIFMEPHLRRWVCVVPCAVCQLVLGGVACHGWGGVLVRVGVCCSYQYVCFVFLSM